MLYNANLRMICKYLKLRAIQICIKNILKYLHKFEDLHYIYLIDTNRTATVQSDQSDKHQPLV